MGIIKTKGIVISENNLGDFDKMVTLLTPSGKIGCSARGARRNQSQLMAGTQYLCFGEYMIFKSSNSYKINSCETIEVFYNLRTDLDKLNYAAHITKIIQDTTYENQSTYKVLQLFLNTLYAISETNKNIDLILSAFKMRLMCLLGFMPNIRNCVNCSNEDSIQFFSLKDNSFKCSSCGKLDTSCISLSPTTIDALRYIIMCDSKKLFSFNLPDDSLTELKLVCNLYLNEKLEKEYKI